MKRAPKLEAVARYLVTHAGVPGISSDGSSTLIAPYPLSIRVTTSLDYPYWLSDLSALSEKGVSMAVRHNRMHDSVADAQVLMRLSQFAPLLHDYWVRNHEGRGE